MLALVRSHGSEIARGCSLVSVFDACCRDRCGSLATWRSGWGVDAHNAPYED